MPSYAKFCQKYGVVWSFVRVYENHVYQMGVCVNRVYRVRVYENRVYKIRVCVNRIYRLGVYENSFTKSGFVSTGFIDFGYMKIGLPNLGLCQPDYRLRVYEN
jgi:hypothetical protein